MENTKVLFEISEHYFNLSGKRTIDKGWRSWVGPYDLSKDVELPSLLTIDTRVYKLFSVIGRSHLGNLDWDGVLKTSQQEKLKRIHCLCHSTRK